MKIEINLQLLKNSAKKSFHLLRNMAPLVCSELDIEIDVSKRFFDHIAYHKRRSTKAEDMAERLLIIPFLKELLEIGQHIETREKNGEVYFKISQKFNNQIYSAIIVKTKQGKYFLLSCFIEWQNKK